MITHEADVAAHAHRLIRVRDGLIVAMNEDCSRGTWRRPPRRRRCWPRHEPPRELQVRSRGRHLEQAAFRAHDARHPHRRGGGDHPRRGRDRFQRGRRGLDQPAGQQHADRQLHLDGRRRARRRRIRGHRRLVRRRRPRDDQRDQDQGAAADHGRRPCPDRHDAGPGRAGRRPGGVGAVRDGRLRRRLPHGRDVHGHNARIPADRQRHGDLGPGIHRRGLRGASSGRACRYDGRREPRGRRRDLHRRSDRDLQRQGVHRHRHPRRQGQLRTTGPGRPRDRTRDCRPGHARRLRRAVVDLGQGQLGGDDNPGPGRGPVDPRRPSRCHVVHPRLQRVQPFVDHLGGDVVNRDPDRPARASWPRSRCSSAASGS